MATGTGYLDPQGVWRFGEADLDTLASDLLNLGQVATSQQFVLDRLRLAKLEERSVTYAYANGQASIAVATFAPLPTVPVSLSVTTTRARKARLKLMGSFACAAGTLEAGVAVSGATTIAPNEVAAGVVAGGSYLALNVIGGIPLSCEKVVDLAAGVNTFTVLARLGGAGGLKTITHPSLIVEVF